jgi:TPR repeat protein
MTDAKKDFEDALSFVQRGDYSTAQRLLRSLAEEGKPEAQRYLGRFYEHGIGLLAEDATEAVNWYCKAAAQEYAPAQVSLGRMYEYGLGVEKDYEEAMKWFRKAADQGDAEGRGSIGRMYLHGEGVPKNALEAIRWWRMNADHGDWDSQSAIARVYYSGHGVERDLVQAYFWFTVSIKSSGPYQKSALALSRKNLKHLAKEMTPEQLAQAKQLVDAWKPTHAQTESPK